MSARQKLLTPPMPPASKHALPPFKALRVAKRNVVEVWTRQAYFAPFMAEKYLFRWMYVANNPDAVRHVLVSNSANYEKSKAMQRALQPLVGNGMFVSNGDTWHKQRRIAIPAFHHKRILSFADFMSEGVEGMLADWEQKPDGSIIALDEEMANVTAGVVCKAMFSEILGEKGRIVYEGFSEYQAKLTQIDYAEMLGLPSMFSAWPSFKARRAAKRIRQVIEEIVGDRWDDKEDHGDFLSSLLLTKDSETGKGLTKTEIRDEMAVIFLAGHETTANTLSWALYLISQAPDVEARLVSEINEVLEGRTASFDDVINLKFARAVVDETLRLYPPVPVFSRTAVAADVVDGHEIKAGSNMMVSPWLMHRHRALWKNPNRFDPDRFLTKEGRPASKYAYIPFGVGPRTCLGASFALTEAVILLTSIVQKFSLAMPIGKEVAPVARLSLRPHPDLPMVLKKREKS
jgi:cytochrome P450